MKLLLTDTVGFVRRLPHQLVEAFRSTLQVVVDADLLLHVIDASDPCRSEHIETTEKLLVDLGLERIPRILVFNKCDMLQVPAATLASRGVPISVATPPIDVYYSVDLQSCGYGMDVTLGDNNLLCLFIVLVQGKSHPNLF